MTDQQFKQLYNIVVQNLNIASIIIYNLYRYNDIRVDQTVYLSRIIENTLDEKNIHLYNFYRVLNDIFTFEAFPKTIILLWNSSIYTGIDPNNFIISNTYKSNIDKHSNTKIVYVPYQSLFSYFDNNKEQLIHEKKYINFNNFNRVIGVPISTINYNINYLLKVYIDKKNYISYNIMDSVATKMVRINDKMYNILSDKKLIDDYIITVCDYLKLMNMTHTYQRTFCSSGKLAPYFINLFDKTYTIPDSLYYNEFSIGMNELKLAVVDNIICEHLIAYKELIKNKTDYFQLFNKFIYNYIDFKDNLSICKICGEELEIFNMIEKSYLKKHGEIIITITKENIFQVEKYSKFIDAPIFLSNCFVVYDNLFNSSRYVDFNNTCRLILDYFIDINTKRLEYENIYNKEIDASELFFIRLSNTTFSLNFNDKEKYSFERLLNIFIIIGLSLIITSNFNELVNIIIKNNIFKIDSAQNKYDLDDLMVYIIKKYLIRQKIIKNNTPLSLKIIVQVYISILTPELQSYYNILITRFHNNIKSIFNNITHIIMPNITIVDTPVLNYLSPDKLTTQYFNYENIKYYPDNIISGSNVQYIMFDKNIVPYDIFTDVNNTSDMLDIINSIEGSCEYKNHSIIESDIICDNTFYIYVNKLFFFDIESCLNNNNFKCYGNVFYLFFNMFNPIPFLKTITPIHFNNIITNLNYYLNNFNINYNVDMYIDTNVTIKYIYYIIYNIFKITIGSSDIKQWILDNTKTIQKQYNDMRYIYYLPHEYKLFNY